jgi:sugar lactone lactonase YvrE
VLERSDLRADIPPLERLAPFLYAGVASALCILVFVVIGPFELASVGGWTLAAVAVVSVWWAATGYSRRTAAQVALVGAVAAFSIFSLRAGVLASWGHPDSPYVGNPGDIAQRDYGEVPTELLVYTQSSGDIPILRDQIAEYARNSGLGKNVEIVVDATDGFSWPWAWYLRDYRRVGYPTVNAQYQPQPNAIILAAQANASSVQLNGDYDPGVPYHHRRWFPEEYRTDDGAYTTHDFFGDVFDFGVLSDWLDFWVRRTLPASEPGTVDGVAFFPRGAGVETVPAGPTVRTEGTHIVIGGQGFADGQLNGPSDVALDGAGNIYVADTNNNRIQKYDAQGNFLAVSGGFNTESARFEQPWSLVVADDGTVFVADTWAHRVVKLDADLSEVQTWGGGCTTVPECDEFDLFGPRDIALAPNGNVLITDTGNSRVIEYTANGEFVRQFGQKGDSGAALDFSEPVGIVVAENGDIYIGDFWHRRVVVLDEALNEVRTIAVEGWGSQGVTDRAYMALLADGRLLVTDPEHGSVLAFAPDGVALAPYELPAEGRQPFARPIGIASNGTSVMVSDSAGSVVRIIPLAEVVP